MVKNRETITQVNHAAIMCKRNYTFAHNAFMYIPTKHQNDNGLIVNSVLKIGVYFKNWQTFSTS